MKPDILKHFLVQARITKLSEEDRLSCEGGLSCEGLTTIEECVKALDTFENERLLGMTVYLQSFIKLFRVL